MFPSISDIEVFLAIVREGSLRAAATSLGVGASAVSHRLKALEQAMGIDLFVRTTRSIELTDAGRVLLQGAAPAVSQMIEAIEEARETGNTRKGLLRLTLPWSAYKIALAPVLSEFQSLYPDVRLDISFDEALVDVVRGGFHAGIRLGDRLANGMVAIRLTPPLRAAYSANSSYLDKHGRPMHPRDLLGHKCIRYRFISANQIADWQFREGEQTICIDPPTTLVFDSFQSVVQAASAGHGIGWSLHGVIEGELAAGVLETVLDPFTIEHPPFYLYYPEQNKRLELLRLLIDFLMKNRNN